MLAWLHRVLDTVTSAQFIVGCVWVGFALVTVALLVLMRTRWGQSQPLRKCMVLSLLAHLLFVAYATTIHVMTGPPQVPYGPGIRVVTVDETSDATDSQRPAIGEQATPWEELAADPLPAPDIASPEKPAETPPIDPPLLASEAPRKSEAEKPAPLAPADAGPKVAAAAAAPEPIEASKPEARQESLVAPPLPEAPPLTREAIAATDPMPRELATSPKVADAATPSPEAAALPGLDDVARRTPAALAPEPLPTEVPLVPIVSRRTGAPRPAAASPDMAIARPTETDAGDRSPSGLVGPTEKPAGNPTNANDPEPSAGGATAVPTPEIYKLRTADDRVAIAGSRGGSPETEAAVRAALAWLAANQSPDGHWDSSRFGGGHETKTLGHDRRGAGAEADSAMTGLALLTFMGAGNTHRRGEHQGAVKRGLDYLIGIQAADGNLAGQAEVYAFMYCHGMAAMALSEAYAMTRDARLSTPVHRAIGYTLAAQNPATGGWRYRPQEAGDTSQLGWQLMALKSAELAGLRIPNPTREGMIRFLGSVASGEHGGLAGYRRAERPSPTMTAEALVCRIFLGEARDPAARKEAGDYVLADLPGREATNYYYWYYATLAMYQLQDDHWRRWNEALTTTLVKTQRSSGELAGSWDPDSVWGGYGGRVYSTTLAALCLEVYYRYLPLHAEVAGRPRENR